MGSVRGREKITEKGLLIGETENSSGCKLIPRKGRNRSVPTITLRILRNERGRRKSDAKKERTCWHREGWLRQEGKDHADRGVPKRKSSLQSETWKRRSAEQPAENVGQP